MLYYLITQSVIICPGYCFYDSRERRVCVVSWRSKLYADWQFGAEKTGVSVSDELCQEPAGHGHHGGQHVRQGNVA